MTVARRVCRQWKLVIEDLFAKQQRLELGNRLGSSMNSQCCDHFSVPPSDHTVLIDHHLIMRSHGTSIMRRHCVSSAVEFVLKYCKSVTILYIGDEWRRLVNRLLKVLGKQIICLAAETIDVKESHFMLMPQLRHIHCKRICYRESANIFHFCPLLTHIVSRRVNYESLFALPSGVQVHDEEQMDRYSELAD